MAALASFAFPFPASHTQQPITYNNNPSTNNISTIKPPTPRALARDQIPRIARQLRMMHHMRPINSVHRRHPVIQPQREVFVKKIGGFVRAVDGVEGEGGRADWDVEVFVVGVVVVAHAHVYG
jgi:hypothetical protein